MSTEHQGGVRNKYVYRTSSNLYTPDSVSLANYKNSTLLRGISIKIAPKVGIFPEAEGQGKYSLPRVQCTDIPQGLNNYFIT